MKSTTAVTRPCMPFLKSRLSLPHPPPPPSTPTPLHTWPSLTHPPTHTPIHPYQQSPSVPTRAMQSLSPHFRILTCQPSSSGCPQAAIVVRMYLLDVACASVDHRFPDAFWMMSSRCSLGGFMEPSGCLHDVFMMSSGCFHDVFWMSSGCLHDPFWVSYGWLLDVFMMPSGCLHDAFWMSS